MVICALVLACAAPAASSKPQDTVLSDQDFARESGGAAYANESSEFFLDLSSWQLVPESERDKVKKSKVSITRLDSIRKNKSPADDFKYEFWTTGLGIDPVSFESSPTARPEFGQVGSEPTPDGKTKRLYHLTLPTKAVPVGTTIPLKTQFNFWNNFQEAGHSDWRARIKYPTKLVSARIAFPEKKRVRNVQVWLTNETDRKEQVALSSTNPPQLEEHNGRQTLKWKGLNVPGNHLILFEWEWEDR
jgi:hypothetical protein